MTTNGRHGPGTAGTTWRKATKSNGSGSCVLMADLGDGRIGVRDSKDPDGPVLRFTRAEIDAWLDGARNGEFDELA
jgi:hypothetical protein